MDLGEIYFGQNKLGLSIVHVENADALVADAQNAVVLDFQKTIQVGSDELSQFRDLGHEIAQSDDGKIPQAVGVLVHHFGHQMQGGRARDTNTKIFGPAPGQGKTQVVEQRFFEVVPFGLPLGSGFFGVLGVAPIRRQAHGKRRCASPTQRGRFDFGPFGLGAVVVLVVQMLFQFQGQLRNVPVTADVWNFGDVVQKVRFVAIFFEVGGRADNAELFEVDEGVATRHVVGVLVLEPGELVEDRIGDEGASAGKLLADVDGPLGDSSSVVGVADRFAQNASFGDFCFEPSSLG